MNYRSKHIYIYLLFLSLPSISFCGKSGIKYSLSFFDAYTEDKSYSNITPRQAAHEIKEIETDIVRLSTIYNRRKYKFEYDYKHKDATSSKFKKGFAAFQERQNHIDELSNKMIKRAGLLDSFLNPVTSYVESDTEKAISALCIEYFNKHALEK